MTPERLVLVAQNRDLKSHNPKNFVIVVVSATWIPTNPESAPSGVPIKRVVLLRTMKDPVRIPRKMFDHAKNSWVRDPSPRGDRIYVGGNNHHIEIREDAKGQWSGTIVTMFDAARRVRIDKLDGSSGK